MPLPLVEYGKMDGVKDLPISVKGPFCQALKAEDSGDHAKAEEKLADAIAAEAKLHNR